MASKLSYWQKRLNRLLEIIYDKTDDELEKELARQYIYEQKKVIEVITKLYNEILAKSYGGIDTTGEKISVSKIYKYNKYYKMLQQINEELNNLGIKQIAAIEPKFSMLYKSTRVAVGESIGGSIATTISESAVKKVINSVWCADGLNWSARIWKNKALLVSELEKGLIDCVARGDTADNLTKRLMEIFSSSYSNTKRLVRTELAHILVESSLDEYKERGVEKVIFCATKPRVKHGLVDDRTCKQCKQYDGMIYEIDSKTKPTIPVHVNCRCLYSPVVPTKEEAIAKIRKMRARQE